MRILLTTTSYQNTPGPRREGQTLVIVTHADRVLQMDDGRLIAS